MYIYSKTAAKFGEKLRNFLFPKFKSTVGRWPWVVFLVAALSSAMIFNLRDSITPYVKSEDICNNENVMQVFEQIFPKIKRHCDEIKSETGRCRIYKFAESCGFYCPVDGSGYSLTCDPRRHILIILDIWLGLVFILSTMASIAVHRKFYDPYVSGVKNLAKQYPICMFMCVVTWPLSYMFFFVAVFIWWPVEKRDVGRHMFVDILSSWGVGAAGLTLARISHRCESW